VPKKIGVRAGSEPSSAEEIGVRARFLWSPFTAQRIAGRALLRKRALTPISRACANWAERRYVAAGIFCMGTKPGSDSIRLSHAEMLGYGVSEMPPSGACAVYV